MVVLTIMLMIVVVVPVAVLVVTVVAVFTMPVEAGLWRACGLTKEKGLHYDVT